MKTLITPQRVLQLAFSPEEVLSPTLITEQDIASAEHKYLRPVLGATLHDRLLLTPDRHFIDDFLAPTLALFVRQMIQPRLDTSTTTIGTLSPRTDMGVGSDLKSRQRLQQSLLREAQSLLRRTSDYLDAHPSDFPEYNPQQNPLKHCSIHGNFVQTF